MWLGVGVLILVSLLALVRYAWYVVEQSKDAPLLQTPRKILLVTAHPDDEACFFTPTVRGVLTRQQTTKISLLCLSNGNAHGLGRAREAELRSACKYLKISSCTIIDDPQLQDGWLPWDPELVQKYIRDEAQKLGADTVITFDEAGVSGHPNHCSVAKGAILFARDQGVINSSIEVLALSSVSLLRKYIGVVDVLFTSKSEGQLIHVSSRQDAHTSMQRHASQYVWYRLLFVAFSRYALLNNLRKCRDGTRRLRTLYFLICKRVELAPEASGLLSKMPASTAPSSQLLGAFDSFIAPGNRSASPMRPRPRKASEKENELEEEALKFTMDTDLEMYNILTVARSGRHWQRWCETVGSMLFALTRSQPY